jgi:hypothetical protein
MALWITPGRWRRSGRGRLDKVTQRLRSSVEMLRFMCFLPICFVSIYSVLLILFVYPVIQELSVGFAILVVCVVVVAVALLFLLVVAAAKAAT